MNEFNIIFLLAMILVVLMAIAVILMVRSDSKKPRR